MSRNLTILVLGHETDLEHFVIEPADWLKFNQEYYLFDQIQRKLVPSQEDPHTSVDVKVKTEPLPKQLQIRLAGYNCDKTRVDKYGNELTFTTAEELSKAELSSHTTERNEAVMIYVRALQRKTPIVFYWH
jgi:predicted ATP-dependent protease